ncbi:MAG: bifunctional nicotinamidase/pyrazinamidase [Planctomycetia bacterium]|nr:bifunctional nicotinamidase/pyrazinamidase [Planctomycetia bacterium]
MRALIVVDIQNDFLPGGPLAVPRGDEAVAPTNRLLDSTGLFDVVVATQDWHPQDHGSFAANHPGKRPGEVIDLAGLSQILWRVHCVQGTRGAKFAPGLHAERFERVFRKGQNPAIDSYSGFFDNGHRQSTGLAEFLRGRGVGEVYILGLATDYCVKFTALDARELGLETWFIEDACRGVELHAGDVQKAIEELTARGVRMTTTDELLRGGPQS